MDLTIISNVVGSDAHITVIGEMTGSNANEVKRTVDRVLGEAPARLVLHFDQLTFMSSAGLRVLIFAKQKSPDLKVFVVKPRAGIVETLQKTGFFRSVYIVDAAP